MRIKRRGNEPISIAFLDVITCGFGAIILLLMIAKFGDPPAPEEIVDPRRAQISALQRDLFNLRRDVFLSRTKPRRQTKPARDIHGRNAATPTREKCIGPTPGRR